MLLGFSCIDSQGTSILADNINLEAKIKNVNVLTHDAEKFYGNSEDY